MSEFNSDGFESARIANLLQAWADQERYGLEDWIQIVEMSSICHDYVVRGNSWQFRPWIISLLSAHSSALTALGAEQSSRKSRVTFTAASVITARSSIVSGSSCSRQPQ